jgi:hypothetical protein
VLKEIESSHVVLGWRSGCFARLQQYEQDLSTFFNNQRAGIIFVSKSRCARMHQGSTVELMYSLYVHTGCLMKNASTHNFFIYYPISMNEKIKDMVLQALQNSHKIYFFWRYLQ